MTTTASQSFDRVIRLRNALTHFKPEWPSEAVEHEKLSKRLSNYAARSPWFPDEDLFPRAWATHETSVWAVSTVLGFIVDFSVKSGVTDRLRKHMSRLDPKGAITG